jgi:hypothetical protein
MNARPRLFLSSSWAPGLGVVLLLAALPGAWLAPQVFFAAWLAACWFDLGIVLGALSWLWIHRLTGGTWGRVLRPHALRLAARLPRLLVLFLPLLFGLKRLYPWLDGAGSDANSPIGRDFLDAWHAPAFLGARFVFYAVVWLGLAYRARRPLTSGAAAASAMLHLMFTSLASVDVLVALVPGWSSSVFGLIAIAGQAFGGGALVIALACRTLRLAGSQPVNEGVPLSRDFGNLLLTAVLLWAYLSFMQLLVIWAENLPREISWYVPRLQTGWLLVGTALVVLHLALPLLLLLFRKIKDSPRRLEWLALAMVGAHALDVAWLVMPSVAPHALAAWWLLPLLLLALPLLSFGGGSLALPALRPKGDLAKPLDVRA